MEKPAPVVDPGLCHNGHNQCEEWAAAGECTKNPGYMTGAGSGGMGACRLACGNCKTCDEGDKACILANRQSGGYLTFEKSEFKGLLD